MENIGAVILSFEEAGELSALLPWKELDETSIFSGGFVEDEPSQSTSKEKAIFHRLPINGLVYLSTCNRVELIYSLAPEANHQEAAVKIMNAMPRLPENVTPRFISGREVARHLLSLSLGLESLVLGETEIRAQLKQALDLSSAHHALSGRLRTLFQLIFQESRNLRNSLSINQLPISIATLVIRRLREQQELAGILSVDALSRDETREEPNTQTNHSTEHSIVVIGSGPMSRQSAEYLSKWAPNLILVNRTLEKIADTAERLNTRTCTFDDFMNNPGALGPISAIISATSRKDAFITPEFLARVQKPETGRRSLALVDMALPGDMDPTCAAVDGIEVIDLESLRRELEENKQKRQNAAEKIKGPLEETLIKIEAGLIASLAGPLVTRIQKGVRNKSRERLELLLDNRLNHLSQKDKRHLYSWAIQTNKELNRIHRRGVEEVLRNYYVDRTEREDAAPVYEY